MNESVYYTVDRIHEAIARNLQVRFRYFDWGVDGRKHERPATISRVPMPSSGTMKTTTSSPTPSATV